MRDDMVFLANPYLADLRLAPPEPLSPSLPSFNVQPRVVQQRALGPRMPTAEDDGFRPLAPADARMFIGRNYDPARTYRRNRLTGEVEPVGGLPADDDAGQTATQASERSQSPLSDRERLLRLGRGEQNYSPWNREQEVPPPSGGGRSASPAAPPSPSIGRRVLDSVGDAVATTYDWLETRGNRAFGEPAGLPRSIVENSGIGHVMPSVMPYTRKYLPTADEATNFIRRHGGIFPVRGHDITKGVEAPARPETNLPGLYGKTADSIAEAAIRAALLRMPPSGVPLTFGALTGGGGAYLRELDRRAKQRDAQENSARLYRSGYGFRRSLQSLTAMKNINPPRSTLKGV